MATDVQFLKTIDHIKTAIELGNSENLAADVAKLTAMVAGGIVGEGAVRSYKALQGLGYMLQRWRLGKAVSGNEADIARAQALAGLAAAELIGQGIDLVNSWNIGGSIYDLTHDEVDWYDLLDIDKTSLNDFWKEIEGVGDAILKDVNDFYRNALDFILRSDPLTLDLDADGIETTSANTGITFDFDGDGLKTGTGWVKGDDGFLVLDRNGNGTIDTGRELFGVDTVKRNGQKAVNGFDALSDLDSNADGVFDAKDAQFANVRVWEDQILFSFFAAAENKAQA